jgi:ferritin-like metal-binding protein YciE
VAGWQARRLRVDVRPVASGVSEGLIAHAKARRADEVVRLLQQNLEQEQHTLEEVRSATEKVANEGVRVAA